MDLWTYGHSIGNTGVSNEAQTAQNPFNFGQDRGNNAFDVRHSANVSVLYQLPVKTSSKAAKQFVEGWEIGGVYNARTGLPIDITLSELALETFFPADAETAEALRRMAKNAAG